MDSKEISQEFTRLLSVSNENLESLTGMRIPNSPEGKADLVAFHLENLFGFDALSNINS
jgi:hypothetical protein